MTSAKTSDEVFIVVRHDAQVGGTINIVQSAAWHDVSVRDMA